MKQTVYPTRDSFPPASFWRLGDAMVYAARMAIEQNRRGVQLCPAHSFELHWQGAK